MAKLTKKQPISSSASSDSVTPLTDASRKQRSETLFSKSKSMGFWKIKRRSGMSTELFDEPEVERRIGGLEHRSSTESDHDLDTHKFRSKTKTVSNFKTLFVRKSSHGVSVSTTSARLVGDVRKQPMFDILGHLQRGCYRSGRSPFATQSNSSGETQWPASDSDSSPSCSDAGVGSSWSHIPLPPIIVSAPTPPNALCFANLDGNETSWAVQPLAEDPNSMPGATQKEHAQVPMIVKMLQNAARRLKDDPGFTRLHVFRFMMPIVLVVYVIGVCVFELKKEVSGLEEPSTGIQKILTFVHDVVFLGTVLAFSLLAFLIWVGSKLGHSFCELNLGEVFRRGIFVQSEGKRFTDTDFVVGSFITCT